MLEKVDLEKKVRPKSLVPFAASSIPLVTLGTFFLWFGWFGFNGFSQLAMGTFDDVTAITKIAVNTHLAGAAGVVTGAVVTRLLDRKTDVVMMLNGALAGLVAITAEPLTPTPGMALVIGSIGIFNYVLWYKIFRKNEDLMMLLVLSQYICLQEYLEH